MASPKESTVKVWDPLVRIGHWTLVLTFFTAYLTGDEIQSVHVIAGYVLALVVAVRLLWGFVGTPHARFSNFLSAPSRVRDYLKSLLRQAPQSFVGHNPAGGLMIVLLLACLALTAVSGLALYGVEEHAGPLAGLLPATEAAEEFWEELHEIGGNLLLLLIVVHVSGVIVSSYLHRENLVKAMVTGRKRRSV